MEIHLTHLQKQGRNDNGKPSYACIAWDWHSIVLCNKTIDVSRSAWMSMDEPPTKHVSWSQLYSDNSFVVSLLQTLCNIMCFSTLFCNLRLWNGHEYYKKLSPEGSCLRVLQFLLIDVRVYGVNSWPCMQANASLFQAVWSDHLSYTTKAIYSSIVHQEVFYLNGYVEFFIIRPQKHKSKFQINLIHTCRHSQWMGIQMACICILHAGNDFHKKAHKQQVWLYSSVMWIV